MTTTSSTSSSGATATISGLISGMDTASIIDQLMTLNAQPQTQLKSQVTSEQAVVTALQGLNTQIAAIGTKAGNLASASGWNAVTASSSSADVTVSAAAGASTGSASFRIDQLASAYGVRFNTSATLDTRVSGATGTTVTVTTASGTKTLDTGDGSLQGLVGAINASGTGLKASTVKLDDGTYRLRVDSTTTGANSAFSITDSDGNDLLGGTTVASVAADAAITIGTDTIHSSSNTFTGLIQGVSVTLSSTATIGSSATVSSTQDVSSISASIQDLVNALNTSIDNLNSLTAFNTTTETGGTLSGESTVRSLAAALRTALYPTDGTSMAKVGIQIDRDGHFTFDADAFATAYAADPAGTQAMFTTSGNGFASRVAKVATTASDAYTGTLTSAINSHNDSISRLNDSIDAWDIRLDLQRTSLTAQFTAMETAMSTLQSQSSWLSSQISQLSANSSSSK